MQYVASISYGKDSLAMLHVIIDILHKPLDRIITAEVWATDTIQADLPPMVEFKEVADRIIKERWGIEVEHFCAKEKDGTKRTYEKIFYKIRNKKNGLHNGDIRGFPRVKGAWCNSELKMDAIRLANKSLGSETISYIGIASDEAERIERHSVKKNYELPLVEADWAESLCYRWCEQNNLLSPLYKTFNRGGCWFCHNQSVESLRNLRKTYPDLWELLLKWDNDTPDYCKFKPNGITVHDIDKRFQMEDEGYYNFSRFGWDSLKEAQMNIDQFLI